MIVIRTKKNGFIPSRIVYPSCFEFSFLTEDIFEDLEKYGWRFYNCEDAVRDGFKIKQESIINIDLRNILTAEHRSQLVENLLHSVPRPFSNDLDFVDQVVTADSSLCGCELLPLCVAQVICNPQDTDIFDTLNGVLEPDGDTYVAVPVIYDELLTSVQDKYYLEKAYWKSFQLMNHSYYDVEDLSNGLCLRKWRVYSCSFDEAQREAARFSVIFEEMVRQFCNYQNRGVLRQLLSGTTSDDAVWTRLLSAFESRFLEYESRLQVSNK